AYLRPRGARGAAGPHFAARALYWRHHMWPRRDLPSPALAYAARATGRVWTPPPYIDYGGYNPYKN
ncbi:PrsW family intramembrane metalloprotease, partial [Streptomyces niveus]